MIGTFLKWVLGQLITPLVEGLLAWWRERRQRQDLKELGAHEQAARNVTALEEAARRAEAVLPADDASTRDKLREGRF